MVRLILASLVLVLASAPSWARGDANVAALSAGTESVSGTPALADQLDTLIAQRLAMIDIIAPVSAAGDEASVSKRRAALLALDQFVTTTVEGLIEASPNGEMRTLMDERLRPILAQYRNKISAALASLGGRADAQVQSGAVMSQAARVRTSAP